MIRRLGIAENRHNKRRALLAGGPSPASSRLHRLAAAAGAAHDSANGVFIACVRSHIPAFVTTIFATTFIPAANAAVVAAERATTAK